MSYKDLELDVELEPEDDETPDLPASLLDFVEQSTDNDEDGVQYMMLEDVEVMLKHYFGVDLNVLRSFKRKINEISIATSVTDSSTKITDETL